MRTVCNCQGSGKRHMLSHTHGRHCDHLPGTAVPIDVLQRSRTRMEQPYAMSSLQPLTAETAVLKDGKVTYTRKPDTAVQMTSLTRSARMDCGQSVSAKGSGPAVICVLCHDDNCSTYRGTAVSIDVLSNDQNKDGATICNVQSPPLIGGTAVLKTENDNLHTCCRILRCR